MQYCTIFLCHFNVLLYNILFHFNTMLCGIFTFNFNVMLSNMQTRTGFVMDSQRDHIQPGPIDDSVLMLQLQHRSQAVWFDID